MIKVGAFALTLAASPVLSETIVGAYYSEPTDRYDHGVLGDAVEWGALVLTLDGVKAPIFRLPLNLVFEDTAPRLVDIDGDEDAEVIVVESSQTSGARLAVYDETGRIAATPYIGQRHRWLAPIGAADLDGDGLIEIALIDRPHLAKVLRIWRLSEGELIEVASQPGFSNHKIGWNYIAGGIRICDEATEMILASADWSHVIGVGFRQGALQNRVIGTYKGPQSLNAALDCK